MNKTRKSPSWPVNYQLSDKTTALTAAGSDNRTRATANIRDASARDVQASIQRKRENQSLRAKSNEEATSRESHTFEELDVPVDLVVHTRSPEKWLLIDRETGQTYQGKPSGSWDKLVIK